MTILTKEQQNLASENHNLIYKYLYMKNLDIDEYYDLCAIGLCNAVKSYSNNKGKISTLAFKCMDNEVKNYHRKNMNSMLDRCVSYDTDNAGSEDETYLDSISHGKNFEKNIHFELVISETLRKMNRKEKFILIKTLQGYNGREIAKELNVSSQYVYKTIKTEIKNKFKKYYR